MASREEHGWRSKLREFSPTIARYVDDNLTIRIHFEKSTDDYSSESNIIEEKGHGFRIMKVAVKETWKNKEQKVRKCVMRQKMKSDFGRSGCKTILLVGATGAGKSTLLDGIFNFVLGVKWEDRYRLKLVSLKAEEKERQKQGQALSQTEWVTAYTLPADKGTKLPYDLVIVDTPGFGDTRGVKQDEKIVSQMKYFFENSKDHGIDTVDGVCFVVQASLARLTATQKYIFQQILSMFGKDIVDNIFPMLTFADGQKPQVIASLKEHDIPYKKSFKFNNSVLFVNPFGTESHLSDTDDDDEEKDTTFAQLSWDIGMSSFAKFFKHIETVKAKSLTLSAEVLKERENLKCDIQFIEESIKESTQKMVRLKQERDALQHNEKRLKENQNFEIVVQEESMGKIDAGGRGAMNCTICLRACHWPCNVLTAAFTYSCCTFNWDGSCRNCGCAVGSHSIDSFKYGLVVQKVKRTVHDIKRRYDVAKWDKEGCSAMIKALEEDYMKTKKEVEVRVETARFRLEKLRKISLRPDPITGNDYIDLLIQTEQREAKEGFKQRIDALEVLKKTMEVTERIDRKSHFLQSLQI